jgi:hypothetical protein
MPALGQRRGAVDQLFVGRAAELAELDRGLSWPMNAFDIASGTQGIGRPAFSQLRSSYGLRPQRARHANTQRTMPLAWTARGEGEPP